MGCSPIHSSKAKPAIQSINKHLAINNYNVTLKLLPSVISSCPAHPQQNIDRQWQAWQLEEHSTPAIAKPITEQQGQTGKNPNSDSEEGTHPIQVLPGTVSPLLREPSVPLSKGEIHLLPVEHLLHQGWLWPGGRGWGAGEDHVGIVMFRGGTKGSEIDGPG